MKKINIFIFLIIICCVLFSVACSSTGSIDFTDFFSNDQNNIDDGDNISQLKKEILKELNFVRTNPKSYSKTVLEPMLKYFDGKYYKEPGKITKITREGASAVQECINALTSQTVMDSLTFAKGLNLSAQWLADDQAKTGAIGHTGSDGSDMSTRINRYGKWNIFCAENCAYGFKTAREIVAQLLIDDGVKSRGHRKNILNSKLKRVGIGYSDKNKAPYGAVTVMDFAGSYTTN